MSHSHPPRESLCHYFVDEAGDGTLFNKRKQIVVGREGCSKFLAVAEKASLVHDVDDTRMNEYGVYYSKKNPLKKENLKK